MKRVIAFLIFMVVFIAAGLFIAGDIHIFEWKPESRALMLILSAALGAIVATCPALDLD